MRVATGPWREDNAGFALFRDDARGRNGSDNARRRRAGTRGASLGTCPGRHQRKARQLFRSTHLVCALDQLIGGLVHLVIDQVAVLFNQPDCMLLLKVSDNIVEGYQRHEAVH